MKPEICAKNTTPDKTATQLDTEGYRQGDPSYVPTVTLTDTRDGNTYTISKLADGRCWMTQNLRIADKTITSDDSDVEDDYIIPASSLNGFSSYDTSNAYVDNNDGGFYSWYAATAGTGTRSLSTRGYNTSASICPKGWRLPTSGSSGEFQTLYNNYNSPSALRSNPVNLTLSGHVSIGSRGGQDSNGHYWSSTADSVYATYGLYLSDSYVNPAYTYRKDYGFSVRCIADDETRTIHDLANMQEMRPTICANTTTPLRPSTQLDTDGSHYGDPNYAPTKTLTDTRDSNTYTVSKLADGKCWMTQNLRIIDKTITPADSDVTSNFTIPISSTNGYSISTIDTLNAFVNSYSGYYNWYTATAGTGTQSISSGNATASICPKGWRLPTGGNSGELQALSGLYSYSALTSGPINFLRSGYLGDSSHYFVDHNGYYWTSTAMDNIRAHDMCIGAGVVQPANKDGKGSGVSVRCIAH